MNYSYNLYSSIYEVNLDDWNQVVQASSSNVFMDFRFLLTLEKTMAELSNFWYIIFYDENKKPTACTSLSTFQVDIGIVASKSTKQIINYVRQFFPSCLYFKVLLGGLPISIGQNHILFTPDTNQQSIINLLDSIMNAIAISEKARVIIYKEFDAKKCARLDALIKLGYRRADSLPIHCFQPKFSNFSNYCAALNSKYRKNIKVSKQKFEIAGFRITHLKDTDTILQIYTPEIHQLYEAVVQKSEHRLEILPVSFFRELAKNFPSQFVLTVAYKNDKIVGFVCSLCTQSSFYFLFCGIDYNLNSEADIYFNLMYETLEQALLHNVSNIEMGQTADIFKARLGCYQKELYLYMKGKGFLLNWFLGTSSNILFPTPPSVLTYDIYKQSKTSEK